MPEVNINDDRLSIKQTFDAPAEKLFNCFTQPELLMQWHAPGELKTPEVTVDLRIGGKYRICMQNSEGEIHTAIGEYKEIIIAEKLVYSWRWEGGEHPETLVTIYFRAQGQQTEVELIHTGFIDRAPAEHHSQGWTGIYINLEEFIS